MKVPDPAGFVTEVTIGTREDYPEAADPGSRPRFLCGLALRACREIEKALAAAGGGRKIALEGSGRQSRQFHGGAAADQAAGPDRLDLLGLSGGTGRAGRVGRSRPRQRGSRARLALFSPAARHAVLWRVSSTFADKPYNNTFLRAEKSAPLAAPVAFVLAFPASSGPPGRRILGFSRRNPIP